MGYFSNAEQLIIMEEKQDICVCEHSIVEREYKGKKYWLHKFRSTSKKEFLIKHPPHKCGGIPYKQKS